MRAVKVVCSTSLYGWVLISAFFYAKRVFFGCLKGKFYGSYILYNSKQNKLNVMNQISN